MAEFSHLTVHSLLDFQELPRGPATSTGNFSLGDPLRHLPSGHILWSHFQPAPLRCQPSAGSQEPSWALEGLTAGAPCGKAASRGASPSAAGAARREPGCPAGSLETHRTETQGWGLRGGLLDQAPLREGLKEKQEPAQRRGNASQALGTESTVELGAGQTRPGPRRPGSCPGSGPGPPAVTRNRPAPGHVGPVNTWWVETKQPGCWAPGLVTGGREAGEQHLRGSSTFPF